MMMETHKAGVDLLNHGKDVSAQSMDFCFSPELCQLKFNIPLAQNLGKY